MNKDTRRVREGDVVAIKRPDRENPQRVCVCNPQNAGSHTSVKDCLPISRNTPIGKALLGRKSGDEFKVETPSGIVLIQIVEVQPHEMANAA